MKHWYQRPHPEITEYIRTVLILEGFSQPDPDALPLFTSGMPALFCRTEKDQTGNEHIAQLILFGKSVPDDYWQTDEKTTIIAYFFMPFALATIFNIPAASLVQAPLDLGNWNPHKTNALKTQLVYAGSTSHKIEVLDNLLLQQLQQNSRECEIIKQSTDQMMCDPGTEMSALLKQLNLTQRTFQRIFKKYVGVSPNQYRRICQFQLSFTQLRTREFDKLADVAYDNGFADQSHFIRSFKEFTQTTPNDYLKSGLSG